MNYVTYEEASEYFETRLHETAWSDSSETDRNKSIIAASRIINALNYKGVKRSVYDLFQNNPSATDEDIRAANAEQELEFPRDSDTEIPEDIKIACFEIMYALLDGIDPDLELEKLDVTSHGYASVRTTYSRSRNPVEHLNAGVPSATAWRYLKPYVRNPGGITLSRVN